MSQITPLAQITDICCRYDRDLRAENAIVPNFSVLSRNQPSDLEVYVYEPVVCLILQGSKETSCGNQRVELRPGDALLVSHDLPVVSRITEASIQEPYLAAILSIDLNILRSLYDKIGVSSVPSNAARSLAVQRAEHSWLEPFARYAALTENPLDMDVLGSSVLREIHYRLLLSPIGGMLRELLSLDSHASRIMKAISQIRIDFRSPLSVPGLSKAVGMSPSSFHGHFKAVTGTTPLQYQKDLRLMEARFLLLGGLHSVHQTALTVGYESATHFSRDYSRKFGSVPSRTLTNR